MGFFEVKEILAPRMKCKKGTHLREMMEGIVEGGGEGIMLRKIASFYEHGKSQSLLKIKVCHCYYYLYYYFY